MRVKANRTYVYDPAPLDQFDARTDLQPGERVIVRNLPGCPRCNTRGHAHVMRESDGRFAGLVCTGSLQPAE